MKIIDTHNHLYLEEFDPEQETLADAAMKSGIDTILLPNIDVSSIKRMHDLCDRFPNFAYPMMGLHPTSVDEHYSKNLQTTESWLEKRHYYGIGEIGIDLHWDKTHLKEQQIVFEEQLKWSIDLHLPVAIHTRDAYTEVLDSIYKIGPNRLRGVFHSFTGSIEDLEEVKKLPGFKIGINGVITFKNSNLSETIKGGCNIHDIVLETDAPYLAPVPYRGRRNEPTYIWKTAEKVAESFRLSLDDTVRITRKNALDLFKIPNKKD